MTEQFANSAITALNANLSSNTPGATDSIQVVSNGSFPQIAQFRVMVGIGPTAEIMLVTGGSNTTTWTVTRGIEGIAGQVASAPAHNVTEQVVLMATAGAMYNFAQQGGVNTFTQSNTFNGQTTFNANVGIGAAPDSNSILYVKGTSTPVHFVTTTFQDILKLESTTTNSTGLFSLGVDSTNAFAIYDRVAGSRRVLIDSAGKLGWGSSSPNPQGWGHVKGDNATDTLIVEASGGTPYLVKLRRTDLGNSADVRISNSGNLMNVDNSDINVNNGRVAAKNFLATGGQGSVTNQARMWGRNTVQGPPTSGTFGVGDWILDLNGAMWVCVTAGTPGTWRFVGGGTYFASVYQSGNQTIPNNSSTKVVFDQVELDPNSNWSVSANTYTCPLNGRYLVTASVLFTSPTTSVNPIYINVFKNGTQYKRGQEVSATSGTPANPNSILSMSVNALAGDLLQIDVIQISGVSFVTLAGSEWTYAQFTYLGT